MGMWGPGIFQNDTASDWIWRFEKKAPSTKLAFLVKEIQRGLKDDYPSLEAIAACEGVAWSRGHGSHDSAEEAFAKFAASDAAVATDAQAELARRYLAHAATNSRYMGWVRDSAERQWLQVLGNLDLRLALRPTRKVRVVPARKKVRRPAGSRRTKG